MKSFYTLISATAISSILALSAVGQGNVDIGLHQNGQGQLEVKVRPQSDFNGIFSSLVFSIRWDRNSGASLGAATQNDAVLQTMAVTRSGDVRENGTHKYMLFAGFGFQTLASLGQSWVAGQEYTVLTIPVTGSASFELVNDAYTSEVSVNGDYYVSLGGMDRTGVIYKGVAQNSGTESDVTIQPNPNEGEFTFTLQVTTLGDVQMELLNTLGQSVYSEVLENFQGTLTRKMDLTARTNGIYYLKVTRSGGSSVHKIVYR